MALDEKIEKLESKLKKKTGEDKLRWGFDVPRRSINIKNFLKAAKELKRIQNRYEYEDSNPFPFKRRVGWTSE